MNTFLRYINEINFKCERGAIKMQVGASFCPTPSYLKGGGAYVLHLKKRGVVSGFFFCQGAFIPC